MVTNINGAATAYSPLLSDAAATRPAPANPYAAAAAAEANAKRSGDSVSLSDEARALLTTAADDRTLTTVVASGRKALDGLLSDAKAASALKDGRATIDVSSLDRRTLWAVATNSDKKFTLDEQVVATLKMKDTREAALAGGGATARVTGDYAPLYRSYLADLDAAGPEEKATSQWAQDRAAVITGLDQATSKSGAPSGVEGDPVAAYLKTAGGAVFNPRGRDIASVAQDVRSVLDRQSADGGDAAAIDFSKFDGRSLSAVALNSGGGFSAQEMSQAAAVVRSRNFDFISSALGQGDGSGDPSAFGRDLVSGYAAMSDEERSAGGWTPAVYDKIVALQGMSSRLTAMFNADPAFNGGGQGLLSYL
jgi:hypothetical protein